MTTDNRVKVYEAQPGPQTALLQCPFPDVFFGGARGGGKTYALIGDWLSQAGLHGKHARGLWLRRSMPELRDVLKTMRTVFEPLGAEHKAQANEWVFPNGASLTLGYLESDADASRYQGWELTWLGVDEAGTWPSPDPIDLIAGSMRSPHGVPIRQVLTGNPGGPGHNWLKARYVSPAPPYTPHKDEDGNIRVFIPSRLEDNVVLMKGDPNYERQIMKATLGKPWLRKAWREGDWDAAPDGAMIRTEWTQKRFPLPERESDWANFLKSFERLTLSIDCAQEPGVTNDYSAIALWGFKGGAHYILHAERDKVPFPDLRRMVKSSAMRFNPHMVVIEHKSAGAQLNQELDIDSTWKWPRHKPTPGPKDPKVVRFSRTLDYWETGMIWIPEAAPWLTQWLDEHKLFPLGGDKPGVDDWCDTTSQYLQDFRDSITGGLSMWAEVAQRERMAPAKPALAVDPRTAYALRGR